MLLLCWWCRGWLVVVVGVYIGQVCGSICIDINETYSVYYICITLLLIPGTTYNNNDNGKKL